MENNGIESLEQIEQERKSDEQINHRENLLLMTHDDIEYQQRNPQIMDIPNDMELKFLAISKELSQVLPKWEHWLQKLSNYLTEWQEFSLEDIPNELANSSRTLIYELNSYLEIACNNLNDMWILVEWSKLGQELSEVTTREVVWELVYDLYSRCGRIIDCENHPYLENVNLDTEKYDWASIIVKCRPELEKIIVKKVKVNNQNIDDEIVIKTNDFNVIPPLPYEAIFDKSIRDIQITCEKLTKENSIKETLICAKEIIDESPLILLPSINSQARGALKRTLMQFNI